MQEKRIRKIKPFEELTFTDDFIFGKVMSDETICRMFLETILKLKIGEISYLSTQEKIDNYIDSRAVVLDIFLKDEEKHINIEMQTINKYDLPKRARYYQSAMDVNSFIPGQTFNDIKENFVIFICTFDPFKKDFPIYHFHNWCDEDRELPLQDCTNKIFLNTACKAQSLDDNLASFYNYLSSGSTYSSFTHQIETRIQELKNDAQERNYYMSYEERLDDAREEGIAIGLQKGIEQGKLETAKMFLSEGLPAEQIARCTGLPLSEVEKLK